MGACIWQGGHGRVQVSNQQNNALYTCPAAMSVNIAHDVFTMCAFPPGRLEYTYISK